MLRPGDKGAEVLALQKRLTELGYWLGTPDGTFGALTTQAVYALQGAAGLGRDGVVGPATRKALDRGALPRVQAKGTALEIDLSQGTIAFVKNGSVWRVLHTSTGNGRPYDTGSGTAIARTPRGTFSVQRRIDGVRVAPLGRLYRPVYFYGGYAVHGSGSIPAYPASHGCARVSNSAIDMIWRENLMPNGLTVLVHD
jgi:peptidoglycan hydrolase-like protein with peptidoglycan-binding domain